MFSSALSFRAVALESAVIVMTFLAQMGNSAHAAGMERVPTNAQGEPMGEHCANPALSYDGRYLVFQSTDSDLVADDRNGVSDVFVFDYETNSIVRASGAFLGAFGSGDSVNPAISADGRYVVFASDSSALNLPMDLNQTVDVVDNNESRDIFLYDRVLDQTAAVSVWSDGRLLDAASDRPSISGDGRVVVFQSKGSTPTDPGGLWRIFAHNRVTGQTRMISVGEFGRAANADSTSPVISADGRYVAFESESALVRRDTNGKRDIYRYDLQANRVELVSQSSDGALAQATSRRPAISADGSMIAFESGASNLVVGDTNLAPDIFIRDLRASVTKRVSVGTDGEQSDGPSLNPRITAAGDTVVFESFARTITKRKDSKSQIGGNDRSEVYLHHLDQGTTSMVAEGVARAAETRSGDPAVSGDGTTLVLSELPVRTLPEGPMGEIIGGLLSRIGVCNDVPTFEITILQINGSDVAFVPGANLTQVLIPGDSIHVRYEAMGNIADCADLLQVFLTDDSNAPPEMLVEIDGNPVFPCDGGVRIADLASGLLGQTDVVNESDTIAVSFCWTPVAEDAVGANFGAFNLPLVAGYVGSGQSSGGNIDLQVVQCPDELGLRYSFIDAISPDPAGFLSGSGDSRSQFDITGSPSTTPPNLDFIPDNPTINDSLLDRFILANTPGSITDIDTLILVPSEEAIFDIGFTTECAGNAISVFEMLEEVYPQDVNNCTFGDFDSPKFPCFIEVVNIAVLWETADSSGQIDLDVLPVPFEKDTGYGGIGVPAGGDVIGIIFRLRLEPTALDLGNNLLTFHLEDESLHDSDPQFNILVRGCVEGPCCLIDDYTIDGTLAGAIDLIDVPTEDIEGLDCRGDAIQTPAFDGVLDVYPNQTLEFDIHGRQPVECLGTALSIEILDLDGMFPESLIALAGPGLVGFGEEGPAFDPGDPTASDIVARVQWTPTIDDRGLRTLRFRVTNTAGQDEVCQVLVNVCDPPECNFYADEDMDGLPDVVDDMRVPFAQDGDTIVLVPGDPLRFVVCGEQDCGEFSDLGGGDLAFGHRNLWIRPTEMTCMYLSMIGCDMPIPGCDMPLRGFDDPLVDANGDMDPQDPFEACLPYDCDVPLFKGGFPKGFPEDGVLELTWEVYDPSVAVDEMGNPADGVNPLKVVTCSITVIVCPPVECIVSDVFANGEMVSPLPEPIEMGTMEGLIDVGEVIPGQDNLVFKVTGGGGCEGDTVRFDSIEFICFDDMGMPIDVDPAIMGMLEERCVVTDINDMPIVFPFTCDVGNMCMIRVKCSLGADLYEICESVGVRAKVTAIAADKSYMQMTTCGVKARVGQCPEPPVCVIKNFDPPLCTLTGDDRDLAIVVQAGEPVSFDVNFMTECFKFLDLDAMPDPELFFAQLKWSATGVPDWLLHEGMPLMDVLTDSPFQITCAGTPMMGDEGRYEIVFTVMDNTGRMSTCTIVIIVCEGPTCVLVEDTPAFCTAPPDSEYPEIIVFPGQLVDFDFHTSSDCSTEGFEGRPILVNWSIKGNVPDDLVCVPAAPAAGVFVPLAPPVLVSTCMWTPGVDDVGEYEIIFNVMDNCGRMVECRLIVKVCEPPVCSITEITVDDEVFDFMGADKPLVPILPGQELKYTIEGTLNCSYDGFLLNLECDDLPTGAVVDDTAVQTFMNNVTRRTWTVTWTPKVTLDTAPPFEILYCDELVSFDCDVVATSECTDRVTDLCQLNAEVGECPKATCVISTVQIQTGGVGPFVDAVALDDGCYNVQPGDVVTFDVIGDPTCVEAACNVLRLEQKTQPLPSATMMMTPDVPVGGLYGPVGGSVTSTFTWTVTDSDCLLVNPTVVFNIDQLCGEVSDDCTVCFYVGVCEDPPLCELSEFMLRPNPATCFNPNPDEELPFGDLPVEMVDDGYLVYAMPGDTIKLQFCGKTDCLCTTLVLDAEGLPEGAIVTCDHDGSGVFVPCDFPVDGDENIVPYPVDGEPGFRQVCTMVEFTVPPTGSFHITFIVMDADGETEHAECVLWVEVEPVCNDFEPNDECEFPQEILVSSMDPEAMPCGPYLSGLLEERVTPGCQPDTYIVLFNKENEIINANNNGSSIGNGKASGLFDITEANGLSEGNGSDLWLRIGVTGFPDGLIKPFNGYPQNGPHGQLGEFEMTITFYDAGGEIISPAIVQDGEGKDVVIDNPYVYTNEFETGAEAFRINFQAPRAFQGGGVTASASIEIDNSTGLDPLCEDVDFFKYTGLIPMMDYCVTAVGGLSKECTPIDLQLGWFDKQCDLLLLDCDSGPSGVAMLCFVSDVNGEAIIGVTGKGDDDFDGYLVPPPAPLVDGRAVNGCPDPTTDHGVCGCYTLCIMPIDPHTGNLVDRSVESIAVERITEAMHHGDMNMDGSTDTADLGMLMGRYGWSASDGVGGDRAVSVGSGNAKTKSKPVQNGKLSGALED